MRHVLVISALVFATGESLIGEMDLVRYALTQGGLLIVVLVLMYWARVDNRSKHRENADKITALTDIIERAATATELNASAVRELAKSSDTQASAIRDLARAVETNAWKNRR